MPDTYQIDGHKIHQHIDRLNQWLHEDKSKVFPIYVEISPVGHCNHRCFSGDTLINTIYGNIPIKELSEKYAMVPVYTYSFDKKEVFISKAYNILKYGHERLIRVHFKEGSHIDCTYDHEFMEICLGPKKQEEEPIRAENLRKGMRLRALRLTPNDHGYINIGWGRKGRRARSRIVMDYLIGRKLCTKEQVHHIDRNVKNDHPDNLGYCASAKEHSLLHPESSIRMKNNNPTKNMNSEWRNNISKAGRGKKRTIQQRLKYRESKLGNKNPNYLDGKDSLESSNRKSRILKEINHVVSHIEYLSHQEDVYCLQVPATGWFFANDVLVKNCNFCAVDYLGYEVRSIPTETLKNTLTNMALNGVRSVMFAGEGEPLLHKDIAQIVNHAKSVGLDIAFTTNAVALTEKFVDTCLDSISWIKVSLNGGDKETYERIHQAKAQDWDKVWKNLRYAVSRRKQTVIGVQSVLLPDNAHSISNLIKEAKSAGLDYVVIKPYSQHLKSITTQYKDITYKDYSQMIDEWEGMANENFDVICRKKSMASWDSTDRGYNKCYSTPFFWAYIMSTGDVYGCSAYLKDDRFNYGNINNSSFSDIWLGSRRAASIEYIDKHLDISECRKNCRLDKVNKFLWDIKNPGPHKNFI